jgi:para-nitrobenzyl esterase
MYRREFLKYSGLGLGSLLIPPVLSKAAWRFASDGIVVDTAYGKLRGFEANGIKCFKGVPYAGSVSGTRRFLTPAKLEPWIGVRDAMKLGNPSIQIPNQTWGIDEPDPAEDCLTLNIWTPGCDNKKRAVMVYNHGGGYTHGSAGSVSQDGTNLARMFDVVVVETNHRLGLLGYLYLDEIAGGEYKGSGNRGVQDIAIALKWVNDNIENFGGDPENVMIFGESGGGLKTSCLYAMPEAVPYFHKASIESGPGVVMKEADLAAQTTDLLFKDLGISKDNWQRILELPATQLLDAQLKLQTFGIKSLVAGFNGIGAAGLGDFGPVVDGVILPQHPFDPTAPEISKNKPLMVGWNEDEQIFFSMFGGDKEVFNLTQEGLKLRLQKDFGGKANLVFETYQNLHPEASSTQQFIAIYSLLSMGLGSLNIANKKATQNGAPVYLYNFGYKSELKVPGTEYEYGSMHALDIPFKFFNVDNVLDKWGNRSSGMAGNKPERFIAAHSMCEMWTNFAKTGLPKAEGQVEWEVYNLKQNPLMRIDTECKLITDRYKPEIELWRNVFL